MQVSSQLIRCMWANQRLKNKSNHTHVASLVVKLKVKDFHASMCAVYG